MNFSKITLIAILATMILASCGRNYYMPHTLPVMVELDKKQMAISGGINMSIYPPLDKTEIEFGLDYGLKDNWNVGLQIAVPRPISYKESSLSLDNPEFRGPEQFADIEIRQDIGITPHVSYQNNINYFCKYELLLGSQFQNMHHLYLNHSYKNAAGKLQAGYFKANTYNIHFTPSICLYRDYVKVIFSYDFSYLQFANVRGNLHYDGHEQIAFIKSLSPLFVSRFAVSLGIDDSERFDHRLQYGINWTMHPTQFSAHQIMYGAYTLIIKINMPSKKD